MDSIFYIILIMLKKQIDFGDILHSNIGGLIQVYSFWLIWHFFSKSISFVGICPPFGKKHSIIYL